MRTITPSPVTDIYEQNPFQSFWMAGFECTDKLNAFGHRVDFLPLTGHLQKLDHDYQNLLPFNVRTVREGIRWSQVEKIPYQYDWSTVAYMLEQGKSKGIQQVWDLCHFGFPDDLTPLHPLFARRFTALCCSFVHFYRALYPDDVLIVTPINEVSFLAWLGGDVRGTSPYCTQQGAAVKYGLMRAYIEGVSAMRELDPTIRILTTEPLMQTLPPLQATEAQITQARNTHESQFEALEILCGRCWPELGGSPAYLDILGFNFYYNNRWELGLTEPLRWVNSPPDPRWLPLQALLTDAYQRYPKPIVLTETSHPGVDRPHWIRHIAEECAAVLKKNIPFWGICLYPIIDRPDWDQLHHWHQSGLWDAELHPGEIPQRILHVPYAEALLQAQETIKAAVNTGAVRQKSVSVG